METLSPPATVGEWRDATRLIKSLFLLDAGLRFQEPALSRGALDEIQQLLVPSEPEYLYVVGRAGAEAGGGDRAEALRLALVVKNTEDSIVKGNVAQILNTISETRAVAPILYGMKAEFLPRSDQFVARTLGLL